MFELHTLLPLRDPVDDARMHAAWYAHASRASRGSVHAQCEKLRLKRPHLVIDVTVAALLQAACQANNKKGCHPQSIVTLSTMFTNLRAGMQDAEVHRSKDGPSPQSLPASSLQEWMSIASESDIDAIIAELYA